MNTKLWVDDIRNPPDDTYDIARTYGDAIIKLQATEYTDIYLDHDLADFTDVRERTGYDVVMWLVEQKVMHGFTVPLRYHYLTANPVGRKNMKELVARYLLTDEQE
jgi:hypothetical protein